ncbi:hypothetical protein BD626DRAFT_432422 [Schizophyllum amplum]|uniref:F-box domain-containing protein n=1 Tax=Schizophyllum amplum TaxID=97359 RepID=A0A550CDX6_9AGAR|nr:hypothetical protein BD626DRAFT_432422 [Auriculariopsis ampla]
MAALPPELWETILEYLPEEIVTLLSCSLVHPMLVPLCQRHLFATISLPGSGLRIERFYTLLKSSPHIAEYVRSLTLQAPTRQSRAAAIHVLRNGTPRITRLGLRGFDWPSCPESLQRALLDVLARPTLSTLGLMFVDRFPAGALCGTTVRHLVLDASDTAPPDEEETDVDECPPPALETLQMLSLGWSPDATAHVDRWLQSALLDLNGLCTVVVDCETYQIYTLSRFVSGDASHISRLVISYSFSDLHGVSSLVHRLSEALATHDCALSNLRDIDILWYRPHADVTLDETLDMELARRGRFPALERITWRFATIGPARAQPLGYDHTFPGFDLEKVIAGDEAKIRPDIEKRIREGMPQCGELGLLRF